MSGQLIASFPRTMQKRDKLSKPRDPLFEVVVVFALVLGSIFAFGTSSEKVVALPDKKPTVEKASYVVPTGEPETLVSGLKAPWEVLFLPDGQALIDERDSGTILQIGTDLTVTHVAFTRTTPPCEKFCEGGTLGMAYAADRPDDKLSVFVFLTTNADNRILKYDLDKVGNDWQLSNKRVLLKGIDRSGKSTTHNGGRLAIGPDGKLWVSLGDAGQLGATSQNWNRLGGSILRLNLDGTVPEDNPRPGSFVWAKGLRDTQGMAWDRYGNMWTTEFGQDTWDELNLMQKGKNYGWPIAEGLYKYVETELPPGKPDSNSQGTAESPAPKPEIPDMPSDQELITDPKYAPPILTWHPADAACSGIAYIQGSLISACLRGGKLWVIPVLGDKKLGEPLPFFTGEFGRLRKATLAPDGSLWLITSNKDGRGGWSKGGESPLDDRVIRVQLKKIYY
ncbi:MAG: PQQ-dependent sugar dehydrogenase [Microbacteriaceae bacterium]|nr:PQQ-dependent sugar dehydrogenase [Microbacteriaceae bacterium]